jgi:hypothetical protein
MKELKKKSTTYLLFLDACLYLHSRLLAADRWIESKQKENSKKDFITFTALDRDELFEFPNIQLISPFIIVVFTGMFLEAFIFDYASSRLSTSYVKKYLDKLDTSSKWIVIPKLTTNKNFPPQSEAFSFLQEISSQRNKFVHYKSKFLNPNEIDNSEWKKAKDLSMRCVKGIKLLLTELINLEEKSEDIEKLLDYINSKSKYLQNE